MSYLKSVKISKWIFVTPEYKKKDLVKHCHEKALQYRIKNSPLLTDDFDVLVHDIDFFSAQIPIVLNFRNNKIQIDPKEKRSADEITDWKTKEISLVDNAIRKHSQRVDRARLNFDGKVNKLTETSVSDFLDGDIVIRSWAQKYQDQYEKFQKVIDIFERRVEGKCATSSGGSNELYYEIETELKEKLKSSFDYLDDIMIDRLTARVMADWILRCPIDFE